MFTPTLTSTLALFLEQVPMPSAVAELLAVFEVLNVNVAGIGLPLQCLGLGTYQQQLTTTMLAPLVIAAVTVLYFVLSSWRCGGPKGRRAGLLEALPWLLVLSFLVFPMVSCSAWSLGP